ncbi:MAG: ABC transporter ATP-binding protein [Pseudomonadota bacterium]
MAISLTSVTKDFAGRAAVDAATAEAASGDFFVVLGPSGCGKSTLLRLVAGLEVLDGGEIALGGERVAGPGLHVPPETRRTAVVFQSYALWPHMSVLDNVAFPAETAGLSRRDARAEARRHLEAVDLARFAERKPAELSGGQRQRVALARCLASRAQAILMDEPLANLDPHLRAAMEGELSRFHRASGATTLFITHDQREAMALADRIAVMREGRFEQVAAPEEIYARPETEAVARFIGRGAILDVRAEAGAGRAALPELGLEADCAAGQRSGPARLLIRPEDAALREGATARPAILEDVAYRGGAWEALARTETLSEPAPVASRTRLREGERAPLTLTGGWLIPAG